MRTDKITCDRCRHEIDKTRGERHIRHQRETGLHDLGGYDLCERCDEVIVAEIEHGVERAAQLRTIKYVTTPPEGGAT